MIETYSLERIRWSSTHWKQSPKENEIGKGIIDGACISAIGLSP